jgi:HTH domain protein
MINLGGCMSKISKNIKMLDILSSGRKYTCKQLAEILEISPRMVRLYKDELEKEGIYIDTFLGKDGGYQLRSKIDIPSILFNQNDIEIMDKAIKSCRDEEELGNLINLKQKIVNYCKLINQEVDFLEEEKRQILDDIQKSIIRKQSIKIKYYSKGMEKQRKVYPKQIYKYDNLIMVVVQYSEDRNDIRHLNLNRIDKIIK